MRYSLIVAALVAASCSNPPPSPPAMGGATPISVNLTEKLGWDQPAAAFAELSTIGYVVIIDGQEFPYEGVTCSDTPSAAGFECKAPLPRMSPGPHTLGLASFYFSNPEAKSAPAGPLNINVTALVSGQPANARAAADGTATKTRSTEPDWPAGVRPVTAGLDRAADLAFTPDDRLLVAERSGSVRVLRDGRLLDHPALTLATGVAGQGEVVSLAVDPAFARTGFVYAIYTALTRSGTLGFVLARFREAGDTLADAIVILDDIPASLDAHAVLRFGLDGQLYAAFDTGGDPRSADDLASFNGKVLRLNPDGTTPDDAPRKSPVLLAGIDSPRGLSWHVGTRHLWVATSTHVDAVRWPSAPTSLAMVRNDLFVASRAGLMRAALDANTSGRIARAADVFSGVPVRALAVRGDGVLFFATDEEIGRLEQ